MSQITVSTTINAPLAKVWQYFTEPNHITQWAFADNTWEAPSAENDVRTGGKFKTVMAAKDKSASFDFTGTYTAVTNHQLIEYDMTNGRHVRVEFTETPNGINVTETFDPENENTLDMQREGWQAILDNFKKHVETH